MGELSSIDFQQSFKEAAKQLKIDRSLSKSDQIPIPKLNALLKLIATGAMKEVEGDAIRSRHHVAFSIRAAVFE